MGFRTPYNKLTLGSSDVPIFNIEDWLMWLL